MTLHSHIVIIFTFIHTSLVGMHHAIVAHKERTALIRRYRTALSIMKALPKPLANIIIEYTPQFQAVIPSTAHPLDPSITTPTTHSKSATTTILSPNGELCVVPQPSHECLLMDRHLTKTLDRFHVPEKPLTIEWSPQATYIAIIMHNADNKVIPADQFIVYITHVATSTIIRKTRYNCTDLSYRFAWANNEQFLVVGLQSCLTFVYPNSESVSICPLNDPDMSYFHIMNMAISPDSRTVACDNGVRLMIFDISSQTIVYTFCCFSLDPTGLWGTLKTVTDSIRRRFSTDPITTHRTWFIKSFIWSPNSRKIAILLSKGITFITVPSPHTPATKAYYGHYAANTWEEDMCHINSDKVIWDSRSTWIIYPTEDAELRYRCYRQSNPTAHTVKTFPSGHEDTIYQLIAPRCHESKKPSLFISAGSDRKIKLWNSTTHTCLQTLEADEKLPAPHLHWNTLYDPLIACSNRLISWQAKDNSPSTQKLATIPGLDPL